jgi:hypothetical protein
MRTTCYVHFIVPDFVTLIIGEPVTVAVRSEAWVLAGWLLGSWVRIPLKAWMFVRVFLCCVVLCRQRPCDGLITRPRSPTISLNSSRNLLYVRRPRSFKDCRATGEKNGELRSQWPRYLGHGPWSLEQWVHGIEFRSRQGCVSASFCVCCPV